MKEEFLVFFNMHSYTRISVISSLSSGTTLHLLVRLQWNVGTPYLHCLNETFSFLWMSENSVLRHVAAWLGNQIPVFWWNIMSFCSRFELSLFEYFDSWRWGYCVAFKCQDLITWWCSFMTQKNGIFSYTTAETSEFVWISLDYYLPGSHQMFKHITLMSSSSGVQHLW